MISWLLIDENNCHLQLHFVLYHYKLNIFGFGLLKFEDFTLGFRDSWWNLHFLLKDYLEKCKSMIKIAISCHHTFKSFATQREENMQERHNTNSSIWDAVKVWKQVLGIYLKIICQKWCNVGQCFVHHFIPYSSWFVRVDVSCSSSLIVRIWS